MQGMTKLRKNMVKATTSYSVHHHDYSLKQLFYKIFPECFSTCPKVGRPIRAVKISELVLTENLSNNHSIVDNDANIMRTSLSHTYSKTIGI